MDTPSSASGSAFQASGTAAALVRCPYECAALGTLGTVQRAAGTVPFLGGAAIVVFALARMHVGAGFTSATRTLGVHLAVQGSGCSEAGRLDQDAGG